MPLSNTKNTYLLLLSDCFQVTSFILTTRKTFESSLFFFLVVFHLGLVKKLALLLMFLVYFSYLSFFPTKNYEVFFLQWFVIFWARISLCRFSWPGTQCCWPNWLPAQRSICPCLLSAGIKGACHYTCPSLFWV